MKHKTILLLIFPLLLLIWGRAPAQGQFARTGSTDDDEPNWVWYTLLGTETSYDTPFNMVKTIDGGFLIQASDYPKYYFYRLDSIGNHLYTREYQNIFFDSGMALLLNGNVVSAVVRYKNETNSKSAYLMLSDNMGDSIKTHFIAESEIEAKIYQISSNSFGGFNSKLNIQYSYNPNVFTHYLFQHDEDLNEEWSISFNYIYDFITTDTGVLLLGKKKDTNWIYRISNSGEILDSLPSIFPGYNILYNHLFNAHNGRVGAINNAPDQPNGRLGFALLTVQGEVLMHQDSSICAQNGGGTAGGVWKVQASPDGGYFAPMTVDNNPLFPYQPSYLCIFKLTAKGKYVYDTGWDLMWYDHYYLAGAAVSNSGRLVICVDIDFDLNGKSDIFVGELRFNPELPASVVTFPGVKPLHAFPNPAGEDLVVELPPMPNGQLTVTGMGGDRVFTKDIAQPETIHLNTSTWAKGSYIVSYRTGSGVYSAIIIKN
jgi:hypothetical protein